MRVGGRDASARRAIYALSLIGVLGGGMRMAVSEQPTGAPPSIEAALNKATQESAVAWSKGDLDAFMSSYEHSSATVYVTGHSLVTGYDAIRAMYASRFGHGGDLGRLSMSRLEVRMLGVDYALGIGRYDLVKSGAGGHASGIYTLIFHRGSAGWKIISDHTSS